MKRICSMVGLTVFLFVISSTVVEAQTIGNAMVTFLKGKVGSRVGGGECAHVATEALRVAGGEFYPGDLGPNYPAAGDYVWGSLVTVISYSNRKWSDSMPTIACLPGDVIQFGGGAKIGTTYYPIHHTAVVQTVNTKQRPSAVYQQNFNGVRTVQSSTIDVTKLTAGWIRIYRPLTRVDTANSWKFTVVNNVSTAQTYTVQAGGSTVLSMSATAANTAGSFYVHKVMTSGTVPSVVSGGGSVYVINAKGDEIYNPTSGTVGVRQLTQ